MEGFDFDKKVLEGLDLFFSFRFSRSELPGSNSAKKEEDS